MAIKSLQSLVDRLNDTTQNPREYIILKTDEPKGGGCYHLIDGNDRCLVGNGCYHLEKMGRTYKLVRCSTKSGCTGTSDVSSGYMSADKLERWIWALLQGIEIGQKLATGTYR